MLMMVVLSIESSLCLAVSLEDQHYHCRPEKSCPEACPQRQLNERTEKREQEIEAPESQLFLEYSTNARSECVDIATGPLQTMAPPHQTGTSFIQHVSPHSHSQGDLTRGDSAAKGEFPRTHPSCEKMPASQRPIYSVVNVTGHIATSGIHHDRCMMLLLSIRATQSIMSVQQHPSGPWVGEIVASVKGQELI